MQYFIYLIIKGRLQILISCVYPEKWQRIYNKRTALERINGRFDRDMNLENHKVRELKKATVIIDIMMIGMLAMAKVHILNNEIDKIRKLKVA